MSLTTERHGTRILTAPGIYLLRAKRSPRELREISTFMGAGEQSLAIRTIFRDDCGGDGTGVQDSLAERDP